jgi:hypothetical protein
MCRIAALDAAGNHSMPIATGYFVAHAIGPCNKYNRERLLA